ncbi:MAG: DNA repair protein RadA [Eubacteriales bacterium]|jgi:DNA repair protein RadA/Sms
MKSRQMFFCQQCGYESAKWYGKCPGCGEWNSMVEAETVTGRANQRQSAGIGAGMARPQKLEEIGEKSMDRVSTGMAELDRVLGGGLVTGSLVLVGGDPGIGKSTLLLQICSHLAADHRVLYVSGEESQHQIKLRAQRLELPYDQLYLLSQTNLDEVLLAVREHKPQVLIVDSIQTMYKSDVASAQGSVTQVRECGMALLQLAKSEDVTVILVGHVTKDGNIAGPRVLEHMVDAVLYFEGERQSAYRILRGVKNRFGSTNEIGVFEMGSQGLSEVENPSMFLLEGRPQQSSGSCIACVLEGTRSVMAEVQALVAGTSFGTPRRMCTGFDFNRAAMLMAVLEKKCGLPLGNKDVYINVVGGLRLDEPGADLAVALAVASSLRERPLPDDFIAVGEVGLAGELRAVGNVNIRIKEAARLGFTKMVVPSMNRVDKTLAEGMELYRANTLQKAIALLL